MLGRKNITESHTWVEARLSDYLDNQLAASERARLDKHLADCAQCRASLASLRWTVALMKQAPAPALPRSFTLPVPAQRAPAPAFGVVRWATVFATLLLFAVIGVDAITHLGGSAAPASAPFAAQGLAAPTMAAFASQPSAQSKAAELAKPTATPIAPIFAPQAASAPQPTDAPKPAPPIAPPAPVVTQPLGLGAGPADNPTSADTAKPGTAPAHTPRPALASAPTISITVIAPRAAGIAPTATTLPTITATPVAPTATLAPTLVAQAQSEPTPAARGLNDTARESISPLRLAEIGLLFAIVFFGTLTVLLRRKK